VLVTPSIRCERVHALRLFGIKVCVDKEDSKNRRDRTDLHGRVVSKISAGAGTKTTWKTSLSVAREEVADTKTINLWFSRFASKTAQIVGQPYMFLFAVVVLILWAASGPLFHFSDTWQLIINTGTTIITFLVVFLIQNTQNRDAKALHLKLDELIRSHLSARNDMIDIEKLSDEELEEIERRYAAICEESNVRRGRSSKRGRTNPARSE
jgi:low affinity Fe/Cu permease